MSDLDYQIGINYVSNLHKVLEQDEARIKSHISLLNSTAFKIDYKIDTSYIDKKFNEIEQRIKQLSQQGASVNAASQQGALGGMLSATQQQANQIKGLLDRTYTEIKDANGNVKTRRTTDRYYDKSNQSVVTSVRNGEGKETQRSTRTSDRINSLRADLRSDGFMKLQQQIDTAQGAGNGVQQVKLLEQRVALLAQLRGKYEDIAGSSAYKQIEGAAMRTQSKIDTMRGGAGAALDKQREAALIKNRQDALRAEMKGGGYAELQKKIDTAQGAGDKTRQLSLLQQRAGLLADLKKKYEDLAGSAAYKQVDGASMRTQGKINQMSGGASAALEKQKQQTLEEQRKFGNDNQNKSVRQQIFTDAKDYESARETLMVQKQQVTTAADLAQVQGRIAALDKERIASLEKSVGLNRALAARAEQAGDLSLAGRYGTLADNYERQKVSLRKSLGSESNKEQIAYEKEKQRTLEEQRKFADDNQNKSIRQKSSSDDDGYQMARDTLLTQKQQVKSAAELAQVQGRIATLDGNRITSLERSAQIYRAMAQQAKQSGDLSLSGRFGTLADNFDRQAGTLRKSLGGEKNKQLVNSERAALQEELTLAKRRLMAEQQILDTEQRQAKALEDISQRQRALASVAGRRKNSYLGFQNEAEGIAGRAKLRGFSAIDKSAGDAAFAAGQKAMKGSDAAGGAAGRLGAITKSAGRGVLGLASTFTQWYLAAGLVTRALGAVTMAVSGMVKVDRQFAVLRSIFRGTAEEAQKLKEDTLELAVANGRSADEALSSAIGFARLGLTRVQINKLVETSLIAANVAEISSGDAAEKLTALMQQYKLSVDEVAASLGRLNSISNTQNVTVSQLLSNIALTASVARQAGIALEDLEGIIGTTIAATKSSSSEIGNAVKFVLQRIRKPETLEKLKLEFDIDLTKANGDLREGTEILAELARIYPLLTKAEQTRLLDLSAGTRQASRFAAVLENFNRAQNVTANAVGDTNSALRENAAITQTLESKLQSLQTAWVKFAVAIGDTGLLDNIGFAISTLGRALEEATPASKGGGDVLKLKTKEAQDLRLSRTDRPLTNILKMSDNRFSKDELEQARDAYELVLKYDKEKEKIRTLFKNGKISADQANSTIETLNIVRSQKLDQKGFRDVSIAKEAQRMIDELNRVLGAAESASRGLPISQARGRMDEFNRGEANAASQAAQARERIAAGQFNPRTALSDFESFREVARDLPNGVALFGESLARVNDNLRAGNYEGFAKELDLLRKAFSGEGAKSEKSFLELQQAELKRLQEQLDEINERRRDLQSSGKGGAGDIAAMVDKAKELNAQIDEISKKKEEIKIEVITPTQQASIAKFFDNIKQRTDEIRKAFEDIQVGDNTNSPNLKFARGRASNALGVAQSEAILNQTIAAAEATLAPLEKGTAEYDRQKEIQEQLITNAKTRLVEERKLSIEGQQQLRNVYEANRVREGARLGAQDVAVADASRGAGLTEAERIEDQIKGAMLTQMNEMKLRNMKQSDITESPADQARFAANIYASQESAQSRLLDLRMRDAAIQKEQRQAALDLKKAEEDRTKEVSKRLSLASREEQLAAAAIAASVRRGGSLTGDEFLGMSQRTRNIADQFNQQNPFSQEDSPQGKYNKQIEDLDEELARARQAITDYSLAVQKNQQLIEQASAPGGVLAPKLQTDRGQELQGVMGKDGNIVLDARGTVINVQLAQGFEQLQGVLINLVEQRLGEEFKRIDDMIRKVSSRDPDTAPAGGVVPP